MMWRLEIQSGGELCHWGDYKRVEDLVHAAHEIGLRGFHIYRMTNIHYQVKKYVYGDWTVIGAFETREEAEACIKALPKNAISKVVTV